MSEIAALIDKAFDYRGDVTLELKDGTQVVGFVSNRYPRGTASIPEPRLEVMLADREGKIVVRSADVKAVRLTGEDPAAGKSWEEYQARKAAQNGVEAKQTETGK